MNGNLNLNLNLTVNLIITLQTLLQVGCHIHSGKSYDSDALTTTTNEQDSTRTKSASLRRDQDLPSGAVNFILIHILLLTQSLLSIRKMTTRLESWRSKPLLSKSPQHSIVEISLH